VPSHGNFSVDNGESGLHAFRRLQSSTALSTTFFDKPAALRMASSGLTWIRAVRHVRNQQRMSHAATCGLSVRGSISSMVTDNVFSYPRIVMASESPTSTMSIAASVYQRALG